MTAFSWALYNWYGVYPSASCTHGSAPPASNAFTTAGLPEPSLTAKCSGVSPPGVTRFGSAPALSNIVTISPQFSP